MFFKKKENAKPCGNPRLSYFMYRDSLTGQMNKAFAVKEFEKLKMSDCGGVMVHLANADNFPLSKAEEYIPRAAQLIASIAEDEVSRLEEGYFVIFTKDYARLAEELMFFLSEFNSKDEIYAVGAEAFDENEEDFDLFIDRLKRCTQAAEHAGYERVVRDLPII